MGKLKCKHCGNEHEFYTKNSYKGTYNHYFDAKGEETNNSEMFGNADSKHVSKYIYCAECDKKIGKIEDFEAWKNCKS